MELHEFYLEQGGSSLSRRQLMKKLSEHCGSDVLILSGCGVANLFIFKSKASSFLKLVSIDDDDIEHSVANVAKKITQESAQLKSDKSKYDTMMSYQSSLSDVSPTFSYCQQ